MKDRWRTRPDIFLVNFFLILSIVAIVVISSLTIVGIHKIIYSHIIHDAENDAVAIGSMLARQEEDIILREDSDGKVEVSLSDENFPDFDLRMRKHLSHLHMVKIKVFSHTRKIVYSTDNAIIGKVDLSNEELERSLGGEIVSGFETKDTVWDLANEKRYDIDLVETYCPIRDKNNNVVGSFEVYTDVTHYREEVRDVTIASSLIILAVVGGAFGIMFFIIKYAARVIKRLTKREKELAVIAATVGVDRERADELERAYKELKNAQVGLIQAEKLSGLGRLGAGIIHELHSPLVGFSALLQSRQEGVEEGSAEHSELITMMDAVNHMTKIIKGFNVFARKSKGDLCEIDLRDVIRSTLAFSGHKLIMKNATIATELPENLSKVMGDKSKLQQVILNMITNANDAMPYGGELVIRAKNSDAGDQVVIEFSDTGTGIKEDDLQKIFEPFFTTKGEGKGVGLGLSVAYGIIKDHHGEISVESGHTTGTTFTIVLPAIPETCLIFHSKTQDMT